MGYIIGWLYQDLQLSVSLGPNAISKFEILLVKIFSGKQNQILPAAIAKNKFLLFKKTVYGSFFR